MASNQISEAAPTSAEPSASSHPVQRRGEASADPASTTSAAAKENVVVRRHELLFEALQNAEYHTIREGVLLTTHRLFMAGSVIAGTTAFAAVVQDAGAGWRAWVALGPVVFGVLDLVFNLTGRANQHSALRGRFQSLFTQIETAPDQDLSKLRDDMRAIYPTEPPPYPATQALGYNAAVDRLYEEKEAARYRLDVPVRDRIIGQVLRIRMSDYRPLGA